MTYKILLVDDEPANLRLLERLFRRDYQCLTASSGLEALELLKEHDVALLITDQRMPNMTGIELLKHAASLRPHMVRMVLTGYTDVGALVEAINCGQVYKYITKPWNNDELKLTVSRALEHYEKNKEHYGLALANQRLAARLKEMTQGFVRAIAEALEAKDEHVYGHARRVNGYSAAIGHRLGLDSKELEQLSLAAFLHDIGKIGTPESILLKPAALSDEERLIVQTHSERGARMLAYVPEMQDIADIVRYHHEHFDGTGYPEGLQGEQIPLAARIISVVDAYDAMTSPRPFRQAMTHPQALAELEKGSGTRFDPAVVRAFTRFEAITDVRHGIAAGFYGERLSPLPVMLDADEVSFDDLVSEVEAEPMLAASVLREANAPADATPATSIRLACERLGEDSLRRLVTSHSTYSELGFEAEQLWERSLRCATAARLLAERTGIMNPDDAYTLGLLHDIGEVLLRSLFPEETSSMQHISETAARIDREVAAFGVDHAQVGQWVLESCGVPRAHAAAVQSHHDLMRSNAPAALLLHVADCIAHADQAYQVSTLDALGSDRLAMLKLSRGDVASIHQRITVLTEQLVKA